MSEPEAQPVPELFKLDYVELAKLFGRFQAIVAQHHDMADEMAVIVNRLKQILGAPPV